MANNKAVQALISSGADAQKNMFDVWVQFPWDEEGTLVSMRAAKFDIPPIETGFEPRSYHGSTVETPTTEAKIDRKFSLTFRLDASYAFYKQFIAWHQTTADGVNGGVANWATATGKVTVKALTGTYAATGVGEYIDQQNYNIKGDTNATWTFYDVWVKKVNQPSFDSSGGGHIEYQVDFVCGDIDYPFYNAAGITGTGDGGYTAV